MSNNSGHLANDLVEVLDGVLRRTGLLAGRSYTAMALTGGTTNRNIKVTFAAPESSHGGESWVVRFAGKNTNLLGIDRHVELAANTNAAALGLAPEVVAFVTPENYLVTKFIEAAPLSFFDVRTPENMAAIARALREFHGGTVLATSFGPFTVGPRYLATAQQHGLAVPAEYNQAMAYMDQIEDAMLRAPEADVPCHNDLLNANFLADSDRRIWLIDWEYAGMNSRWFDLGNFAVNHEFTMAERDSLLAHYFGSVTPKRQARLALFCIVSDMREAMWNVVQQAISTLDIDFAAEAARLFQRLLANCAQSEFQTWLAAAATPGD